MEILLQNLTLIMAVVGVLAFIVSVITQVFKGKDPDGYPCFCAVDRHHSGRIRRIYGLYPADDYLVHDYSSSAGGVFGGIRRDVWMGKVCRIVAAFCKRKKRKDTVIQLSPGAGLSVIWGRLRSPYKNNKESRR